MIQDRRNQRKRAPARSAAVLLCAMILAGTAVTEAAGVTAGPPGPTESRERLSAHVAGLYRDAAVATARYEKARRQAGAQRAEAAKARRAVRRGEHRLSALHERLGSVARSQYRQGAWSPGSRLMASTSPEALLEQLRAQRQGDHAFDRLLRTTRKTQRGLVKDRAHSRSVLRRLEATAGRRAAAKAVIEDRLALAQRRLAAVPVARAVARAPLGPVMHASANGCPQSDPPARHRAAGAKWIAPVKGYQLSAGFASSGSHWSKGHTGQDFAVPTGTPVRAVGAGEVVETGCGDAFGNQIVIKHPDGYYTQYAHLSRIQTAKGSKVSAGEQIGLSGSTGNSTGPHLHFEVRVSERMGSGVDPVPWLRKRGVDV